MVDSERSAYPLNVLDRGNRTGALQNATRLSDDTLPDLDLV
jgi:hypothetical protein